MDPSDSETKMALKYAYLNALAEKKEFKSKYLDPYDAFIAESKVLNRPIFQKIGRVPIESWLTPKPALEDYIFMTPLDFRLFLDKNGCKDYATDMEKFIEQKVFPDLPFMIGADHSLTGGVLTALAKEYGADNISTIIFDGHFDAIPTNLRLDLAKYSKEHKDEVESIFPEMLDSVDEQAQIPLSYNCGTFLYQLMEQETLKPQNLIVYGCMDYPGDELRKIQDPRVKNYVDFYLSYEEKGVKIIPNYKDNVKMNEQFKNALESIQTPYLYLSIDVDVGSLNAILAARFMEFIGIDEECLNSAANLLKNLLQTKPISLIGLDLMELEVYYLNAKLKSGKSDRSIDIMDKFLDTILI